MNPNANRTNKEMTDQTTIHHDQYQYQPIAYDPNLSSAARYSPPYTTNITTTTTTVRTTTDENLPHSVGGGGGGVEPATEYTTSITYSNLIFVPHGRGDGSYQQGNGGETMLDQNPQAAYVLSSDSRQYNNDIKPTVVMPEHLHHSYTSDDQQLIDEMSRAQQLNTTDGYHIPEEYTETVDGTQIILQGPNGEFYRQVQNVYLDDGNGGGGTSTVEIMPIIDGDNYIDDQQQYQTIFKVEENGLLHNQHNHHHHHHHHQQQQQQHNATNNENTMVLQHLPSVADTVHNSGPYDQFKNEYTVLEPMNRHLLPAAQQQYLVEISNNSVIRPVQPLTMDEKEQQRILLESTMSPLLAAVNDITARDEQLQDFLARSSFKEELMLAQSTNSGQHHHHHYEQPTAGYAMETVATQPQQTIIAQPVPTAAATLTTTTTTSTPHQSTMQNTNQPPYDTTTPGYHNDLKITNVQSVSNEYVDINDMDFVQHRSTGNGEYANNSESSHDNLLVRRSQRRIKKPDDLMVSDKPVPSRAWASLPTAFLHITKGSIDEDDFNIFAKKDIPLRTKFGPYKGDAKSLSAQERSALTNNNGHSRLPLLLLDGFTMLDTSNEYTSNWMRFVQLATNFIEQNLLLFESDQQLFFQTCQPIAPKQQLRVGYGQAYAERYALPFLQPSAAEKQAMFERWPCFECEHKFETFELLQTHLNAEHEECADGPSVSTAMPGKRTSKVNRTRKRRVVRTRLSARKVSGPTVRYACCYCSKVFSKLISFKRHNEFAHSFVDDEARNGASSVLTNSTKENAGKSSKCHVCRRYFSSTERLEKHRLMHCKSNESKLVQCTYCPKQVLTQSALAMHVKSHIFKSRLFHCLYCSERFQHATEIMGHVPVHMDNGFYNCERCHKKFKEYTTVRKHFRSIHSNVVHTCPDCGRDFKSMHKLKQHRLSHSDVREFLCSDCGKQFKRKDKLREHILSIHVKAAKQQLQQQRQKPKRHQEPRSSNDSIIDKVTAPSQKPTKAKKQIRPNHDSAISVVPPTDYHRFIYKCHDCLLGFKRRGMLVNHLAKRHPQVSIDSVPELNLPILKAQRYYYCQYCDKVYKSSSKRKAHILKYHPGLDLPLSSRQKSGQPPEMPGLPNASYSETVGNVTTHPQRCAWCHKQYASKARLLQHQRKQHTEHLREIEMYNQHDIEFGGVDGEPTGGVYIEQQDHYLVSNCSRFLNNGYETENKLLKLSSAALEASLKDDFQFFNEKDTSTIVHQQQSQHQHGSLDELGDTVLSKVDVNFKVVGTDYVDPTSSSGDLNRLPQLFDEIDYLTLKPVDNHHHQQQQQHHHHHHSNHLNQQLHQQLHQIRQSDMVMTTHDSSVKAENLEYAHNTG